MCAYFLSSDSAFSAPKVTQYLNINNKNPPHFYQHPSSFPANKSRIITIFATRIKSDTVRHCPTKSDQERKKTNCLIFQFSLL